MCDGVFGVLVDRDQELTHAALEWAKSEGRIGEAAPEVVAQKSRELGYDKPLPIRFADYFGRVISGNLQTSLRTRNPVLKDLETFGPATLELALMAAAIAAAVGVGLGLMLAGGGRLASALRENVWPLFTARGLKPVIHSRFPLADAALAHKLMESDLHIGKIVLVV